MAVVESKIAHFSALSDCAVLLATLVFRGGGGNLHIFCLKKKVTALTLSVKVFALT